MKLWPLLLLLLASSAWAAPCQTYQVAPSPASTQIWTGWDAPLSYLLIQNVGAIGTCDAYCDLGTNNTVTAHNGTLIVPHGGAWLPPAPIPAQIDLSCSADGCTQSVHVCWW